MTPGYLVVHQYRRPRVNLARNPSVVLPLALPSLPRAPALPDLAFIIDESSISHGGAVTRPSDLADRSRSGASRVSAVYSKPFIHR